MGEPGDCETAVFGQFAEQKEQRNGVRTARKPNEHTTAFAEEAVALDRLSDSLVKGARRQIPNPKSQSAPNPNKSQLGFWDLGFGVWDFLICRRADSNCRPRAYETRALTG